MKVGVIGAGAWGTALGVLSHKSGNDVKIWSFDGCKYQFNNFQFPKEILITQDMKDIKDSNVWIIATPAAFFRETIRKAAKHYKNQTIIICTKGMEEVTNKFMSEILKEELPNITDYSVLAGPQFAEEAAKGIPTGSTVAGTDAAFAITKKALSALYLESSNDVIGAEVCSVGKNAAAIISGYYSVKSKGENEKAMIFTLVWNEIVSFGMALGAKRQTFLSLCGLGDLILSATSQTSRNYSAGIAIAKNEEINGTIEGLSAIKGILERAGQLNVKTYYIELISKLIK